MAVKTVDKKIGSATYTITQYTAVEGLSIKITLGKLFSPGLPKLIDGKTIRDSLGAEITTGGMLAAISALFDGLDPVTTIPFIIRMLTSGLVRRDGVEITRDTFNIDFAGNYLELYKLLGEIILLNYGENFFGNGGIGETFKALMGYGSKPSSKK